MRYLSFDVELLNRIEFQESSLLLGDWIKVAGYCVKQENGGRLRQDVAVKPSFYRRLGLGRSSLANLLSAGLLFEQNGELVVTSYPIEMEKKVQNLRNNAAKARKSKAEARAAQSND